MNSMYAVKCLADKYFATVKTCLFFGTALVGLFESISDWTSWSLFFSKKFRV